MESSGIKFKIAYQSLLLIIDLPFIITVETLGKIIKEQLKIDEDVITIKWTDDEEDACTISSQIELDEAKRIFGISKMEYLVVNVFKGDPLYIGGPCSGEENLYRNGAKRWRQIYCYNSHVFHRKRYNKICFCVVCNDVIWGIGRQGVRCCGCKLFVHKKCCHKVLVSCQQLKMTGSKISADDSNLSSHNFKPQETHLLNSLSNNLDSPQFYNLMPESSPPNNVVGLKDFDFIKIIGRGSYAKVILVRYKRDKKLYALKVIKKRIFVEEDVG
uniref:Protein kinase C iota type (Trinotate prediction) n=1 Tax=Henneguya salminicola TaxID=69463 RepID=A0A6G3MDV3_HENSL